MAVEHKIKFYPVNNGDNTFIKLHDGTTILIDCQIRSGLEDNNGVKIFDVKSDLLSELKKDEYGFPFVDLFILTHPHQDHCLGFESNFFCGKREDYNNANKKKGEIIVGELWITQKIFNTDLCPDANTIRNEANRRIRLFNNNDKSSSKSGNILRIIGYNDEDKTVDGLHYIPGQTIGTFNEEFCEYLELFIHAPFKETLITSKADKDENLASIVFQARFRLIKNGDVISRVFIAGDADHYVFREIMKISEKKGRTDQLKWDLLLAPHHCSWTFFNDTPQSDNPVKTESSEKFLEYAEKKASVIASSVEILDNDKNPPCFQAKTEYVKKVTSDKFYNTANNIDKKAPKPLVFIISEGGISKSLAVAGASTLTSGSIPRAGHK